MNDEQTGRLIKAFVDIRRYLQQIAGQGTLTQGEYLVLRRIRIEREGKLDNLREFKAMRISQYLSMPPPAVSRIFNSLEGKGLIQRQINQDNRRSVIIKMTKSGENALAEAEAKVKAFMNKLIDELGNEDSEKLLTLLERVIEIFANEQIGEGDGLD